LTDVLGERAHLTSPSAEVIQKAVLQRVVTKKALVPGIGLLRSILRDRSEGSLMDLEIGPCDLLQTRSWTLHLVFTGMLGDPRLKVNEPLIAPSFKGSNTFTHPV
jgi:hypothetical protein